MPIVDAHVHIFPEIHGGVGAGPTRSAGYGRAVIGDEEIQIMPPLNKKTEHTPEMLVAHMDWAGVDRAMLLQGPFYGVCNQYVNAAVQAHPDRLMGAVFFDPWEDGGPDELHALVDAAAFVALKIEFTVPSGLCGLHPGARLDDPKIAWLFDELERRELIWAIDLGGIEDESYQTEAVRNIAESHPALRIVIPHLGQPSAKAIADKTLWRRWQQQIDLALLANVWHDCAALPHKFAEEGFPFKSAHRVLCEAFDRVGAGRIMWGTDIPGLFQVATYPQLVELGRLHSEFLSPADQLEFLGQTAMRVYGDKA